MYKEEPMISGMKNPAMPIMIRTLRGVVEVTFCDYSKVSCSKV